MNYKCITCKDTGIDDTGLFTNNCDCIDTSTIVHEHVRCVCKSHTPRNEFGNAPWTPPIWWYKKNCHWETFLKFHFPETKLNLNNENDWNLVKEKWYIQHNKEMKVLRDFDEKYKFELTFFQNEEGESE